LKIVFNSKAFKKDMNNILNYSAGFLDGIQLGKKELFQSLGKNTIELLKEFVDSNARIDPQALHHVYEWNQTGSPEARLFDIEYTVSNLGLSMKSTFSQSISVRSGSNVPFYNKASMMEYGIGVTIAPRSSGVLAFEDNGEQVFTKNPVYVSNPGGDDVQGSYERTFDNFFKNYFSQSFLRSSGFGKYLSNPSVYKKDLQKGKRSGRSQGVATGYRWIANAGLEV
jgi:hypothetical protein